jgi:hypothetical protein
MYAQRYFDHQAKYLPTALQQLVQRLCTDRMMSIFRTPFATLRRGLNSLFTETDETIFATQNSNVSDAAVKHLYLLQYLRTTVCR